MAERPRRLLLAALLASIVVTAAGCGSSSNSNTATSASTTKSAPASTQPAPATNGVGSSITLPAGGTKLAVKVLKVIDPLPGSPKQTGPYAGDRVLAVAISLRNVGTKAYSGTPADAGSMKSTGGEGAPNAPFISGRCAKLEHPIKLAPGQSAIGCLAFDLLPSQNAAKFDFSAGTGKTAAEWHL